MKKINRRRFMASTSTAALGAAAGGLAGQAGAARADAPTTSAEPRPPFSRAELLKPGPQRTFAGPQALQVAMPLGGIGAGCICLGGGGGLQDFSIRQRPQFTALSLWSGADAAFAVLRIVTEGSSVTKVVEGPIPRERIYDQGMQGQGFNRAGHEGFPRFEESVFKGEYPFGEVSLRDPQVPLAVTVTGWNPFVPLDDASSGIPCAILEYRLGNPSARAVDFEFSYHVSHLAPGCARQQKNSRNRVIPGRGVFFSNIEAPNSDALGSAALVVVGPRPVIKAMWLRSPNWEFDSLSALWKEVSTGAFTANDGWNETDTEGRNGGSILLRGRLEPGQRITYPIVITWHFPNSYLRLQAGKVTKDDCGGPGCCAPAETVIPPWRPYYVSRWKDAAEVAAHVADEYDALRARTTAFKESLFSSTLPPYVLDAVSANLAILKSPTVLRQENGNVWAWEGCLPDQGCCHGSCTHVWNYAQALPHLFPHLERTLRAQELERSMDETGHVTFRAALPDGPVPHDFRAAADGQLGGIMKVYRDWQICGDLDWLRSMYPLAKRSLDYAIRTWDPDRKGAVSEPHHNTYDIEFWGPDGMCTSLYVGALSALAHMAHAVGRSEDAPPYEDLAKRAAGFMSESLFNGEYFQQRVQYVGLRDTSFADSIAKVDESSSEFSRLLKREGPKYQYGSGCLSDGVIGAWMARIYGIETPLDREKVKSTLRAIFRHNFRTDLSEHANAQRPGYAMGHEPGLLLCSWPRGGKPTLPFVYSDEVWTGIEYQVASHLILEGLVEEGLTIVKALRSRYDGRVRNPWNEYECGSYYARAMASYALLAALSGFRYSAARTTLWFGPRIEAARFRTFFSTATGFGQIAVEGGVLSIEMTEGRLVVTRLVLGHGAAEKELEWNVVARPGQPARRAMTA